MPALVHTGINTESPAKGEVCGAEDIWMIEFRHTDIMSIQLFPHILLLLCHFRMCLAKQTPHTIFKEAVCSSNVVHCLNGP